MSSEGEHLDGVAKNLQNAAEGILEKPQATSGTEGEASAGDSPASGFIKNAAHIVLDKSNHAADSSKAYIENVVHKLQDYAQNAASGSNIQETLSKAVHVGASPGNTSGEATPASGNGDGGARGLVASVTTWCSSLCGSKDAAADGEPRSVDFRSAADNVAHVLQASTTTSSSVETPSSHAVTPAEDPAKPTLAPDQ